MAMTENDPKIFGPVLSRRLGFSLGLDIVPFKTCSLDCVYCQLGSAGELTTARRPYVMAEQLLNALAERLKRGDEIDWITFSGSGEPTLNSELGAMIRGVKALTPIPVAVITNSTLLDRAEVREELAAADLVVPSLDAGTEGVFQKINRPFPGLTLDPLAAGIAGLARSGGCRVWLEVMLARGINDAGDELDALAERIKLIEPELVQLNTPVRPPGEEEARALSPSRLASAAAFLAARLSSIPVEAIGPPRGSSRRRAAGPASFAELTSFLQRRPATLEELVGTGGGNRSEIVKYLAELTDSGLVVVRFEGAKRYFAWRRPTPPPASRP